MHRVQQPTYRSALFLTARHSRKRSKTYRESRCRKFRDAEARSIPAVIGNSGVATLARTETVLTNGNKDAPAVPVACHFALLPGSWELHTGFPAAGARNAGFRRYEPVRSNRTKASIMAAVSGTAATPTRATRRWPPTETENHLVV
jgi:hypothetical protein